MPKFTFKHKHQLTIDDAKYRLSKLIEELKIDFGSFIRNPKESWTDYIAQFSFEISGGRVDGIVKLIEDEALLEISYPIILIPFRNIVEKEIKRKAIELLS